MNCCFPTHRKSAHEKLPNALCTPHLGFVEQDNYERYFGLAFENINHFAAGRTTALVNPDFALNKSAP